MPERSNDVPNKADGVVRSPEGDAPATAAWSKEDMEAAIPLPLPSIEAGSKEPPSADPYSPSPTGIVSAGKGNVSPGGAPEAHSSPHE